MNDKTKVLPSTGKFKEPKNKKSPIWKIIKILLLLMLLAVFVTGVFVLKYAYDIISRAPEINPKQLRPVQTSYVYDHKGVIYTTFHGEEDRTLVEYKDIPKHLVDAFVAIEDERYWTHPGIDLRSIFRAAYKTLSGQRIEGASTITQQLIKLSILSPEKTIERKLQEQFLAIQLNRMYTKEEIMQMYLNRVFLGHYAHGIQAASMMYFGKDVPDLTLAESALLAGLNQIPNHYSPYNNMDGALARRNVVLNKMRDLGYISAELCEEAKQEEIVLSGSSRKDPQAFPQFTWYAKEVAKKKLVAAGVAETEAEADSLIFYNGLHIYTTIDIDMQRAMEEAVLSTMEGKGEEESDGSMGPQIAAILIDPKNGEVRAAVGDRDITKNGLKRYAQSQISPGSSIKPVLYYALALDSGEFTPGTTVDDAPISYNLPSGIYRPQNYDRDFKGLVSLRTALVRSLNIPAVKIFQAVGIDNAVNFAKSMGINSTILPFLSSALGSSEVNLEEMVRAYGVLSNKGVLAGEQNQNGNWESTYIRKITDSKGNILYQARPMIKTVIKPSTAYLMTDILQDIVARVRSTRSVPWPSAGKSGTTQGSQYVWFLGYTADYSLGVWIGHDKYPYPPGTQADKTTVPLSKRKWQERQRLTGSGLSATLWSNIMTATMTAVDQPKVEFEKPEDITEPIAINSKTGMLPGPFTPTEFIYEEIFLKGTEPMEMDNFFQEVWICTESSKLATNFCPHANRVVRYRFVRTEPYETLDEEGNELLKPLDSIWEMPTDYCDVHQVGLDPWFYPEPEEPTDPDPGTGEPTEPPSGP